MSGLKRLYVGRRDDGIAGSQYEMGTQKKDWHSVWGFSGTSHIESFCCSEFERVTGIKLKPGDLVKVNLSVKVVSQ